MAEGNVPKPKVPTTPQDITSPQQLWDEYFGDSQEWNDYYFNDIRARHVAVLSQDGEEFLWLKRMLSGTRCPFWDKQAGNCRKPLDPQATCFNVGYLGGFHQPALSMLIGLPSANRQIVQESGGPLKVEPMQPWTVWTPRLTDRDMVINRRTSERFELNGVRSVGKWRGNVIAQFFDMRPMQIGVDFAYNVSVDFDI